MRLPLRAAAQFELAFRPAIEDDLELLARIYASTRIEEVAQTGWPPEAQQAFLQQQHEAQHAHYRSAYAQAKWEVIEQRGVAIGRLYWDERCEDIHIIDIALLPEFRGCGIGTAIVSDILDYAFGKGKGSTIHVEQTNPARSLYLRLGFKVLENHGLHDLMRAAPARQLM